MGFDDSKAGSSPVIASNLIPRLSSQSGSDSPSFGLRNIPFFQKYWLRSLHKFARLLNTTVLFERRFYNEERGQSETTVQ